MAKLRELDRRSAGSIRRSLPGATAIVTLLREAEWEAVLLEHLDRELVQYLLAGIRDGFWVGFVGELGPCGPVLET